MRERVLKNISYGSVLTAVLIIAAASIAVWYFAFSDDSSESPSTLAPTATNTPATTSAPLSEATNEPGLVPMVTGAPTPPVPDNGETFYVTTGGDDDNTGTTAEPWRTLQHAVDNIKPGDTVLVRAGTYVGMRIEKSGIPEAWNTIKAAPDATVVLNEPGPNNKHESILEIETWEGDGIVAYWVIEGLEVAGAPSWGIDIRGNENAHSHHFVVRGNRVHDNGIETGRTGIFTAFVDDVSVEENESYRNGEHGIYLGNSGDRFFVGENRLHHNVNCGLHINGDASQGGDGIISDGLIEENVIFENGEEGCSGINMDGVTNTVIRNNLLYENHGSGIALFQDNGAVCSHDNFVFNNTVVMPEDGRWALTLSDSSCVNNQVLNNILLTSHSWRGSITLPESSVPGFVSDFNLVTDRFSFDSDESVIDFAEWRESGYGANSIVTSLSTVFIDAPQL